MNAHTEKPTRLSTLTQSKAERIVFERLWAAFIDCEPKIMVVSETAKTIEAIRDRIIAGEALLRSDMNALMAHLRIEPEPDAKTGRAPMIWVQQAWFIGFIAEYLDQNGDGPLPMGVVLQAMCEASDNLLAVVTTSDDEQTLRIAAREMLGLSGTLDIAHDGPSLKPSRKRRALLKKTFGSWEDAYSDSAA